MSQFKEYISRRLTQTSLRQGFAAAVWTRTPVKYAYYFTGINFSRATCSAKGNHRFANGYT